MNEGLLEVAKLLFPILLRRLPRRGSNKGAGGTRAQREDYAFEALAVWLSNAVPDSVVNDPRLDSLELLQYCLELLKEQTPGQLEVILGGTKSPATVAKPLQMSIYLTHIDVPSDAIYYEVRSAVAAKWGGPLG